jgi:hypothetical protein
MCGKHGNGTLKRNSREDAPSQDDALGGLDRLPKGLAIGSGGLVLALDLLAAGIPGRLVLPDKEFTRSDLPSFMGGNGPQYLSANTGPHLSRPTGRDVAVVLHLLIHFCSCSGPAHRKKDASNVTRMQHMHTLKRKHSKSVDIACTSRS